LFERRIPTWTYECDKRREYEQSHIHLPPTNIYIRLPEPQHRGAQRESKRKEKEKERKENEVASSEDSVRAQAHSVKRGNY
jgi:hypothetical protein